MNNIITLHIREFVPSWAAWCFGATTLTYSFGEENVRDDSGGNVSVLRDFSVCYCEEKKVRVDIYTLLSGYRDIVV